MTTTKTTKTAPEKFTLAGKLAKIGDEIGKIDKGGYNKTQNFKFIEYAEVAGRIRSLFAQYGVIIKPEVVSYDVTEVKSRSGGIGYHYILTMNFCAINADDNNDRIESQWVSEAVDYGDKGVNKAITSGTKYFIMRLFNISERGDEDNDSQTPEPIAEQNPNAIGDKMNMDAINARLAQLQTEEEVSEAFNKTLKAYPDISPKDKVALTVLCSRRRRQIRGED